MPVVPEDGATMLFADAGAAHAGEPDATMYPGPGLTPRADAPTIAPPVADAHTIASSAADAHTMPPTPAPTPVPTRPPTGGTGILAPGTAFGGRYHVIRLLGAGGMGAVYQAWDNELGVAVALKVIRPEVMVDPDGARDLERRFKRELLLARQVTHKNVVRIHDLGEVEGIKYITMPYIQGVDLATHLQREGKLPVAKVIAVAKQVAQGLAAAHEAGVVHRDLKPANIMVDEEDRAIIMDFGIARSSSAGVTMVGTVVGTLEYMAPEQALGQAVDHRADIYTFGLILYDLLLGRRSAARAESAVAELMKRMQRSLPSARSVDPSIPEALDNVIGTCMQPDPALRFQTTVELVAALEALDRDGKVADPARASTTRRNVWTPIPLVPQDVAAPVAAPESSRLPRRWIALGAVAAVLLTVGGFVFVRPTLPGANASPAGAAMQEQVSIAVLPFRNETGDGNRDWIGAALAGRLRDAVPQANARAVSSERVYQVLRDLRIESNPEIDGATIRRVGEFSNATTVVAGHYLVAGDQLRVEAVLHDVRRGTSQVLGASMALTVDERQLIDAVTALARGIDQKLFAASTRAVVSTGAALSTNSADALRFFSEGVELGRRGNHLDAAERFKSAVAADDGFSLAHAKLAQTYATLGHGADAERSARRAMENVASLPERERHLVEATYAEVALSDQKRAIEAYEKLLALAGDDSDVRFSLARRYESTGAFEEARTHYRKIVESDPKFFEGLFALGRVEVQLKDPQGAVEFFNRALSVAVDLDNDEARGSAWHALGNTYKHLNKLEDAQRHYTEALNLRRRIGDKRGMASTLDGLGQVQDIRGRPAEALASFEESLRLRREINDKRGIAAALNNIGVLYQTMGRLDSAVAHYKEALQLQTELGNLDYQGMALHNIGITLFAQGKYDDAATYLTKALDVRQNVNVPESTSMTLRSLGELHVRLGQFEPALGYYLKAVTLSRDAGDRRGAALAHVGTGTVFAHQGRYRASLEAMKEGLDGLRQTKESGAPLVDALIGYAHAWTLVAGHDEAQKLFQEAMPLLEGLQDSAVVAQALNFRAEDALLSGNHAQATSVLADAARKADASNDRFVKLLTRLNQARTQLASGRAQVAAANAAAVAQEAGALGLRYVAAEAALTAGEAYIAMKVPAKATAALESALRDAERIAARPLMTRARHALGTSLRLTGQPAAAESHLREAARLLSELQNEAGAHSLAKRADFSRIGAPATTRKPPASN